MGVISVSAAKLEKSWHSLAHRLLRHLQFPTAHLHLQLPCRMQQQPRQLLHRSYAAAPMTTAAPVSYAAAPVSYAAAPVTTAAPVSYAAPIATAAPVSYAAAPVSMTAPVSYATAAPVSYGAAPVSYGAAPVSYGSRGVAAYGGLATS